jgi:hypothetical protein
MKIAERILEALNKSDLALVKEEVQSSFSDKEMQSFKDFDAFFKAVDTQNAYEEEWKPRKWKPYYKQVWDEYKSGKLKMLEFENDLEEMAELKTGTIL